MLSDHLRPGARPAERSPRAAAWTGRAWVARRALAAWVPLVAIAGVLASDVRALVAQPATTLPTEPVRPRGGNARLRERLLHERWTERDSVPPGPVLSIQETRDGFLWLGTERGAMRFDGVAFTPPAPALQSLIGEAMVRAIAETPDGALWFAVQERGVVRWQGGVATLIDTTQGLPDHDVRALHVDAAGTLWIGGGSGLARLVDGRVRRLRSAALRAQDLGTGPDGGIWVASQLLSRVRGDSVVRVAVAGLYPGEEALTLQWTRDGSLWLGTVSGLVRLEREPPSPGATATAGERWRVATRLDARSGLSAPYVRTITEDRDGRLWATTASGVFVVADGEVVRFDARDGLSADAADVVQASASGSVWVATQQGLDRFRPRTVQTITGLQGLEPHFLWSIAADGDGLWLGTSGGGLYWTAGDGRVRRVARTLPSQIVYGVMPTADGTLWLRTGAGLSRYRAGRPVPIPVLTVEERSGGRVAFVDRGGALWVGGEFGVVRIEGGGVRRLRPEREAPVRPTNAIAQTADGTVWMKGSDLVAYRDGQLRRFGASQGVRAATSMVAVGDELWVGTYADGLLLVRGGRVHAFPDVPVRRRIYALLPDDADGLWLATDAGLQRVSLSALRARADGRRAPIAVRTLDRSDGLWELDFNVAGQNPAARGRDGRLWFSSVHGAVSVDPARVPQPATPRPVVETVLHDGQPFSAGARAVPRGRGALEIRYVAPALVAPEDVTFRHRLVGYDTGWVDVGARRVAFYTGVRGGEYRFEVQASRGDGRWSPAAAVPIELRARLVESDVFRALAVMVGVVGLFAAGTLVSRQRTRRLRARADELTALVDDRTRALQALNEDLEQRVAERTAELRAEHAGRLRLQEDLQQAQKLDSIGRLAGGIAHDLNNMLSAILTFAELAEGASADEEQRADLLEVRAAGQRASNLTQQLLAFARRQVIDPRVLDLRAVVAGLATLLRRLLGADVDVVIESPPDLWAVRMDPSQVEQVLVNLAVNARDAMPDGGRLTIALANGHVDAATAERLSIARGDYVRLTVADTGGGMSPEVRHRVFEPFFTTKELGKGTGLGLATCYGIVTQAGGAIDLWTDVGRGARFDVWLPRTTDAVTAPAPDDASSLPDGDETILLVDDDDPVRTAARRVLAQCGYTVIEATNGEEALRVASRLDRAPGLLLCDVVMPRLGGVELARHLRAQWPELRVLLMSGYVERALPLSGTPLGNFLRKPFTPPSLAQRVREVLDAPREDARQDAAAPKARTSGGTR